MTMDKPGSGHLISTKGGDGKLCLQFLGDSITEDGTYITCMQEAVRQQLPELAIAWINDGRSSETVSGLSEPDHPGPRPYLHDRLGEVLSIAQPDWVVLCYGMNDGIYYPYAEERFQAYREGYLRAVEQIRASGAQVIAVTPPPFDPGSVSEGVQAISDENRAAYSYLEPYARYSEEVLRRYADWVLTLKTEAGCADVVNIHDPVLAYIRAGRDTDPGFRYGDGIHPDVGGHRVIASELLDRLFGIQVPKRPFLSS
ncbi:GDSL-type esterase/lipase family protein [Paenibacillus filicis]|uniref:GDSL-type esterase/lipase family protein n=1 Tax=Paenibacillus filicis TaxID=669464 RepID=A0ABU9DI60_9BACL